MRRRQPAPSASSSDDSDGSDIKSCFDTEDEQEETDAGTEPTDADSDVEGGDYDEKGLPGLEWLNGEDNAYPPEYYLNQEDDSEESEDEDEDYEDSTIILLDMIKDQFNRCVPYSLIVYRLPSAIESLI
jgi:hypothetical protein